jgi:hypothetical protein
MAQLPNPNSSKPFDRVAKNLSGEDEYGFRQVDGQEEIVHIPSGRSNMTYYQREMVLNPSACPGHEFRLVDVLKREIECSRCFWSTSAHINDFRETDGQLFVTVNKQEYPVIYKT